MHSRAVPSYRLNLRPVFDAMDVVLMTGMAGAWLAGGGGSHLEASNSVRSVKLAIHGW